LTKNKFIVYSDCPNYWNKVYEVDCVNVNNDATVTLFKQIDKYLDRKWWMKKKSVYQSDWLWIDIYLRNNKIINKNKI
jgi:hypothetical protein